MRVRVRPMRLQDVNACVNLLASNHEERQRYGPMAEHVGGALVRLLRSGSLNSSVLEDTDHGVAQVVAWGASVFVTDDFVYGLKKAPPVWIGPQLVRRVLAGD